MNIKIYIFRQYSQQYSRRDKLKIALTMIITTAGGNGRSYGGRYVIETLIYANAKMRINLQTL